MLVPVLVGGASWKSVRTLSAVYCLALGLAPGGPPTPWHIRWPRVRRISAVFVGTMFAWLGVDIQANYSPTHSRKDNPKSFLGE